MTDTAAYDELQRQYFDEKQSRKDWANRAEMAENALRALVNESCNWAGEGVRAESEAWTHAARLVGIDPDGSERHG